MRRFTSYVAAGLLVVCGAAAAPVAGAAGKTCGGRVVTILGTPGDDVLTGTTDDDVIAALQGDDRVEALAGETSCAEARAPTPSSAARDPTSFSTASAAACSAAGPATTT